MCFFIIINLVSSQFYGHKKILVNILEIIIIIIIDMMIIMMIVVWLINRQTYKNFSLNIDNSGTKFFIANVNIIFFQNVNHKRESENRYQPKKMIKK